MELRTLGDAERYLARLINLEKRQGFDYEQLGLGRIRALAEAIGRPQEGLPCVHIAGSKGKGSTALAVECLLREAGLETGTYTSPHLVSWRERFRIGGEPIGEAALVSALRAIQPAIERQCQDEVLRPSFFDVTTALAFWVFREAGVDAAVIEVGLGGRLDSTNIVEPRVSVLTSVQLEHTDKLGSTLDEIAFEKAGILRKGVRLVHGPLASEAEGTVLARAVAEDVPVESLAVAHVTQSSRGLEFALPDGREVTAGVLGRHQATNLGLAIRAAETFLGRGLTTRELDGLGRLRLPARIESFGDVILDSAHSPDSARALRETLEEVWPGRRWTLVASISSDKNAHGILSELAAPTRKAVFTRAESHRSAEPDVLARVARDVGIAAVDTCEDPVTALVHAREALEAGDLLVLCGSVYLAGAVRPALLQMV